MLHILIVDDSPEDCYTVRRLLRADPRIATVTEVDRGDRALAICQATPPDCVLLDYRLPDMDGLEVLARLRAHSDVPVVLLTGVGNEALAVDALQRGAQDYLVKGQITSERLRLTIERAIATVALARERDRTLALLITTLDTLQASETRYQTLFETMTQGVVYQAADGQIITCNPAAEHILGMTLAQMQGRTSLDPRWRAIHPDGSPFPGETHPAMVALRTGQAVRNVVMGVYDWDHDAYRWIAITAVPQLRPGAVAPAQVYATFDDITERVLAEQAAAAALSRLDALITSLPNGIGYLDHELRYQLVNPALAAINGRTPADHLGRTPADLLPGLAPRLEPLMRQVLATGVAVRDLELHGQPCPRDGVAHDWLISYFPVPGPAGDVAGVGVSVTDLTQSKRTEAALQASMAKLASALASMTDAVFISDIDGRFIEFNDAFATFHKFPNKEACARTLAEYPAFLDVFFPDGALAPLEQWAVPRALRGETATNAEYTLRRRDTGETWVGSYSFAPIRDHTGAITGSVVVGRDITARKQVEDALRQSEELFSKAFRSSPAALKITRLADGNYIEVNDAYCALVGYARAELIGHLTTEFPIYIQARDHQSIVDHLRATGSARGFETSIRSRSGDIRHVIAGQELITFNGEACILSTFLDITARKQAEVALEAERTLLARRVAERTADLSAANAELAQTARVKDEFLSNMSHELRTPLNAILGRAELLREQIYGPLTPQQDVAVQSVVEAGQHLLGLINDILDLSKVEAGKLVLDLAPLEVESIGLAAVRMVSQLAISRKITLTSTYDSQIKTVLADGRRLKQILVNLLANAVKFTPEGGKVGLEVQANPAQQVVTFTVWDTGIGIAPEDQARLFQPFVQIDRSLSRQHEGTGLGLALVLRLTELHGGSVTLASRPGQGSRFTVALPWPEPAVAPAESPMPRPAPALTAPLAIRQALVIEDSRTSVEQLRHYLGDLGSRVEVHDRASGAIERARDLQPDLIVLDILLPDQTGWEVLRQLKADPQTAAIPVLVLSVVDDPIQARTLGAAGFLLKPLTRDGFLQALSQLRVTPDAAAPSAIPLVLVVVPQTTPARPLVLLVDDNAANLEVLVDYLPTVGYDVVVARNGAEAVAQAEERHPALIVMDIQMPVMDGLEATRRIRAAGLRTTPIIALTALAMPGDRERCLAAGATAYLAKPVGVRVLMATITRVLTPDSAGEEPSGG